MITAKDAYSKTLDAIESTAKREVERFTTNIIEATKNGLFSIKFKTPYDKVIAENIAKIFRDQGFYVEISSSQGFECDECFVSWEKVE